MAFINVDLPAPLGPSTATNSPWPMVSETSERIGRPSSAERLTSRRATAGASVRGSAVLGHRPVAWCRAACRRVSWATCHCWKEADAGDRVSVTVTIGMPAARAGALRRWISGVTFCEL